ncbi:hypothetical protein LA080_008077 [Diaporthe eres]|nr:hypothetical protein LA080_008077 [Diaporthe eres]
MGPVIDKRQPEDLLFDVWQPEKPPVVGSDGVWPVYGRLVGRPNDVENIGSVLDYTSLSPPKAPPATPRAPHALEQNHVPPCPNALPMLASPIASRGPLDHGRNDSTVHGPDQASRPRFCTPDSTSGLRTPSGSPHGFPYDTRRLVLAVEPVETARRANIMTHDRVSKAGTAKRKPHPPRKSDTVLAPEEWTARGYRLMDHYTTDTSDLFFAAAAPEREILYTVCKRTAASKAYKPFWQMGGRYNPAHVTKANSSIPTSGDTGS